MTKVFFVYGMTESGDDWSIAFKNSPTAEQIIEQINANEWLREEYEAECIQGWNIREETIIDNE